MCINIYNYAYSYKRNEKIFVIENLNFSIEKGTINVILGLNGSGKTTLIKSMAGLLKDYNGKITINNLDLKKIKVSDKRKIISYVSQNNDDIFDYTVLEYLSFGLVSDVNFYKTPSKEQMRKVIEKAKLFGLEKLLDKKIDEISGGQRQIVRICCSLIQDSDIIILDEPTSALDLKNQYKVLSILKEIKKNNSKTIILSSHNPNHALFLESNVLLLKSRNSFEYGDYKSIIKVKKLREVYGDKICLSRNNKLKEISYKNK